VKSAADRRWLTFLPALPLIVALAGCMPSISLTTSQPASQSRASIQAVAGSGQPIKPTDPVVVVARNGRLSSVTVTGPQGALKGTLSPDGATWTANPGTLGYGTTYQIQATAMDSRGVPVTSTATFSTIEPEEFFAGEVSPASGSVVGVGLPITVTFTRGIKDRAAVERAMVIHTPDAIEGAWSWQSSKVAEFRPRGYWPGNTKVTVDLNIAGIEGSPGVFGKKDTSTTFSFGPAMVTKVDAQAHEAAVYKDGRLLRRFPITTGKAGFETRSGIKVVLSKERSRIMDAASGGTSRTSPDYYRVLAEYAMRITPSGEFLHAAPWSVGWQGRANVSHGCVGMSTSNAQWLYDQTMVGDVVEVTGTPRQQDLGNGITIWNETWEQWLGSSATGPVWTSSDAASQQGGTSGSSSASPTAPEPSLNPLPSYAQLPDAPTKATPTASGAAKTA
jgi:lipoprotein-anchoring transpeptidase ErfK/SrfK